MLIQAARTRVYVSSEEEEGEEEEGGGGWNRYY